jgi:hypothetical protein
MCYKTVAEEGMRLFAKSSFGKLFLVISVYVIKEGLGFIKL